MAVLRNTARLAPRGAADEDEMRAEDRRLQLSDGRWLGYAETGVPDGLPVFFFHGFGTTRVVCPPDETAANLGVRLIAVDRPGIGLSEPLPGRRLLAWPADVAEFADRLGVERFGIVGWSGGGPYALACGHALAERVTSVALVSAPAPLAGTRESGYLRRFDRNAVRAADRAPWVIRLAMWHWGRGQRRDAERFFYESLEDMCEADQSVLADEALRDRMIANSTELYRQGGRGMYDEALVLARPWGFELESVAVPVQIWHGARDRVVPIAMPTHLAEALPAASLRVFPDQGHHLLYPYWPQIVSELARSVAQATARTNGSDGLVAALPPDQRGDDAHEHGQSHQQIAFGPHLSGPSSAGA
jgi:pimeloyl-ACP methyl ester carboxylesterase